MIRNLTCFVFLFDAIIFSHVRDSCHIVIDDIAGKIVSRYQLPWYRADTNARTKLNTFLGLIKLQFFFPFTRLIMLLVFYARRGSEYDAIFSIQNLSQSRVRKQHFKNILSTVVRILFYLSREWQTSNDRSILNY